MRLVATLLSCAMVLRLPLPHRSLAFATKSRNENFIIEKDDMSSISSSVACVLSDMDGTLLRSCHGVSDKSIEAIKRIQKLGIKFFPSTGRTRSSMLGAVGPNFLSLFENGPDKIPGVYTQGLCVYGPNGELIHEESLESSVIEIAENFCQQENLSTLAYAGDRIITTKRTFYTDRITDYLEPIPEEVSIPLSRLSKERGIAINKILVIAPEETLVAYRPKFEDLFRGKASLTGSVPGMLEILPFGASKGKGVLKLLEYCNIDPSECMAFGDGENDIEMLQYVKYGIAMSNARPILKKHAYGQTLSNDEDGVARILDMLHKNHKLQ